MTPSATETTPPATLPTTLPVAGKPKPPRKRDPESGPTNQEVRNRLLAYLRPHRKKLTIGLLFGVIASFVPVLIGNMIKEFVHQTMMRDAHGLGLVCLAVVVLYGVNWALVTGQGIFLSEVAQRVGMKMRSDVYAHLQSLSLSYFHKQRTGSLMSTLTNDIPKLQNAAMMIKDVIATPIQLVVYLVALFLISWKLTLFALLVVPLMALSIQLLSRRLRAISKMSQSKMADIASVMEETLSAPRVVKAFTAERHEIARFDRANQEALDVSMSGVRRSSRIKPTVDFIGALGIALTLWVGGGEIARGHLDLDRFIYFLYMVNLVANGVGSVGGLRSSWEEMMGAADRIFSEVLDVVPEVQDAPDARPLPVIDGRIEFRDVSFSYNDGTPVLKNIDLDIRPGQVVALVGHTGAGKSTIADLVPRFYDPTAGVILIDGIDIRTVTVESLREQIGIVPQETVLFSGTIRDNIAYGKRDATEEEVVAAARAANAASFIENMASFPRGYQTVIGERGATLSGGERQRVAIARALLADPRLLILDEATSSLDAATEALVQDALERLMHNRTTLIIAHRLSTIVNADKIVVIRHGGIVETGTHSELIALGGEYAMLYETQQRSAELYLPEP